MKVVKKCVYLLLMCIFMSALGCASTRHAPEEDSLAHGGETSAASEKQECLNISGTYAMVGKALPGMPDYFIVKALPLTLDGMLGLDLPDDQRKIVDRVKFLKRNEAILVLFLTHDRLVKQKEIPIATLTSCDQSILTIVKSSHSTSEGTSNKITVVTRLSLEKDGTLQIKLTRSGRARGLIVIPFSWHEEYGARFAKIPDDGN